MARQDFRLLTWREAPFKRAYYHATSRVVIAPLLIVGMILIGAAFYYYQRYSAIIDAGLRGDIFVRSAGIYAAAHHSRRVGNPDDRRAQPPEENWLPAAGRRRSEQQSRVLFHAQQLDGHSSWQRRQDRRRK